MTNWGRFLKNDSNRQPLLQYIGTYAQSVEVEKIRQLVLTRRDSVLTNPLSSVIRTVDTDFLCIYVQFGVGDH